MEFTVSQSFPSAGKEIVTSVFLKSDGRPITPAEWEHYCGCIPKPRDGYVRYDVRWGISADFLTLTGALKDKPVPPPDDDCAAPVIVGPA